MSYEHTRGPWSHVPHAADPDEIVGANGVQVAHVFEADYRHGLANAKLIASAPELLAALVAMTAAACRADVGMRDRETAAAIPAAQEAIRRAGR